MMLEARFISYTHIVSAAYAIKRVCSKCGRDVVMRSDQRVSTCPHCHSAL